MSGQLSKLMYLEDDPHIYELVQMCLEDLEGTEVKHFWSGARAISAFNEFKPDLLLFDVMLPDMGGVETLEEIRKRPGGKDVDVIFMTAKAQKQEQEEYFRLGALAVIVKPFDAFTLADQIKSIWEIRGGKGVQGAQVA